MLSFLHTTPGLSHKNIAAFLSHQYSSRHIGNTKRESYQKLRRPIPERNLEVSNGGFIQYFDNQYGLFSEMTLDVLRLLQAHRSFEILKEAISKVNYDNDSSEIFRQKIFDKNIDQLDDMDSPLVNFLESITDTFNGLENEDENLEQLYVDYLAKTRLLPILP